MRGDCLGELERGAIEQIRPDTRGPEGVAIGLAEPDGRGGPRNLDSLLRWDPDQGEGVWHATEETELSC